MTVDQLLDLSRNLTVVVVLVLALYGGYREWWVFGYLYRKLREDFEKQIAALRAEHEAEVTRLREERDEWKDLALEATRIGVGAIDRTGRVVDTVEKEILGQLPPPPSPPNPGKNRRERTTPP